MLGIKSVGGKNMPKLALILVMIGSYGLGILGYRFYMSGYRGGHEYFRAQVALERLHWMTKVYLEEHGSLPDIEGLNALLWERWNLGRDHAPIEVGDDDIGWHLNFIVENAIRDNLHLWNSPPHFVLTSASRVTDLDFISTARTAFPNRRARTETTSILGIDHQLTFTMSGDEIDTF